MSDKVQLIKQEIKKLKQTNGFLPVDNHEICDAYRARGYQFACDDILQFIDSLSEEPASEDLEEEISKWRNHYISVLDNNLRIDLRDIEVTADYFAEWGKNHSNNKSEIVIEDLVEEVDNLLKDPVFGKLINRNAGIALARHFAEWQKYQMKEVLQTEYEKGRFDMREEMMKDALDCSIIIHPNDRFANYSISAYIPPLHKASTYISNGDKVKIIIVKED